MQVVVEIMTGTIFDIQVGDNATVLDLKIAIQNQENLPGDRLILLLDIGDDHLMMNDDQKPLSEYGVQNGSRLQAIFKPLDDDDDPLEDEKGYDKDFPLEDEKGDDEDDPLEDEKGDDEDDPLEGEKGDDDDDPLEDEKGDDDDDPLEDEKGDDDDDSADTGDDKVMDIDRTESETEEEIYDNNSDDDSSSSTPKTPTEETTVESPEYIDDSD